MAKKRVVGLDIGTTAVRAAEIEFGSGGTSGSLLHFAEVPLPINVIRDGEVTDQSIVSSALRQLWANGKFTSKDVVIGVGNQRVAVRELTVPWMTMTDLRASLPYQVQDILPMATDDALLDFFPTDEVESPEGRRLDGLLVAASRDTVAANVLAVESAGLRPVMVDLNAFAILRGMTRGQFASSTVALVDVGARITNVVISSGGLPRFVRALPSGGQDITDAVARALSVSNNDAEQLKREIGVGFATPPEYAEAAESISHIMQNVMESIRNTFNYFASSPRGSRIEMIALTGGGAHLPGLGQLLASTTRANVVLGDPLETFSVARSAGGRVTFNGHESRMVLPIGLAMGVAA